jgi:hypothetical protein
MSAGHVGLLLSGTLENLNAFHEIRTGHKPEMIGEFLKMQAGTFLGGEMLSRLFRFLPPLSF